MNRLFLFTILFSGISTAIDFGDIPPSQSFEGRSVQGSFRTNDSCYRDFGCTDEFPCDQDALLADFCEDEATFQWDNEADYLAANDTCGAGPSYCTVEVELIFEADGTMQYFDIFEIYHDKTHCPGGGPRHPTARNGCAFAPSDDGQCDPGYGLYLGGCVAENVQPEPDGSCPDGYVNGTFNSVETCTFSPTSNLNDDTDNGCVELTTGELSDACFAGDVSGTGNGEIPPQPQVNLNSDGTVTLPDGRNLPLCTAPDSPAYGAISYSHCDFTAPSCPSGYVGDQYGVCHPIYDPTAASTDGVEPYVSHNDGECPDGYVFARIDNTGLCVYSPSTTGTQGGDSGEVDRGGLGGISVDTGTDTGTGTGSGTDTGTGDVNVDFGTGTSSGDCSVAPTCSQSDAMLCAILQQQWQNQCSAGDTQGFIDSVGTGIAASLGDAPTAQEVSSAAFAEGYQTEEIVDASSDSVFTDWMQSAGATQGSCIEDISIDVGDFGNVSIPLSEYCTLFLLIGTLVRAAAVYYGSRIIFNSVAGGGTA